jgi:hypothetical protein
VPAPPPGFYPVQSQDNEEVKGVPPGLTAERVNQPAPAPPPGFYPVQNQGDDQIQGVPPGLTAERLNQPTPPPGFFSVADQSPAAVAARHYRGSSDEVRRLTDAGVKHDAPGVDTGEGGVRGFAAGVGKEGTKTLLGAAKLFETATGIPIHQAAEAVRKATMGDTDLETHGMAEGTGGVGENILEFAAGDEALKGVLKGVDVLGKLPQSLRTVAEAHPKLLKALTNVVKGSAVGGAQGAVKGAEEGKALEGAKEGAEGAALGTGVGEVVGAVVKPVAKAAGLLSTAEEDISRAAKPAKRNTNFISDWALAKDRYIEEVDKGGKFKSLGDAADRMREVRHNMWNNEVMPVIQRHEGEIFNTNPVVDAIRKKITPQMTQHAPEEAKILEDFANKFLTGRTVGDAEKDLEFFNAQLEKEGYWQKTPSQRAALDKVDGKIASRSAAVAALRDSLYDHLDKQGEPGMQELKKTYGAMRNVENEIRGQSMVSGRQVPMSLKQMIGLTAGVAHGGPLGMAAAAIPFIDKVYNSPESLLNRAVEKSAPSSATKQAVQKAVGAAGTAAKAGAAVAGEKLAKDDWALFKSSDGQIYRVHPEDLAEAQKRDPKGKVIQ